ncbi:hypothetical protein SLEP1_g58106 [Rubroshorea leprosula]|uniref:Uncharacterized protein n=1 Tax=Rubroshorea leprosula TaxID=152421 RepID=A0AAV5MQM9_9ROSI|nr:hypothetical protein SLEP1_g58106 [Rubroshorea leprosula]
MQSLLSSITKTGTPLQSASSPFVVPSPSTPIEKGINWIPRDGSRIYFWRDRWLLKDPLCSLFHGPFRPHDLNLTLKDILLPNGRWNLDHVAYPLPQDIIQRIAATPIQKHSSEKDSFIWNSSSNGNFSMAKNIQWSNEDDWSWIWKVLGTFFLLAYCILLVILFGLN